MMSIFDKVREWTPLIPKNRMTADESQSFSEASSWCESQPLTAVVRETADQQRRRALIVESEELYREAYRRGEKYDGPLHKRAQAMNREADHESLILLRSQLRTTSFCPGDVGELIRSQRFQDGVVKVIALRSHALATTGTRVRQRRPEGRLLHYEPYENLADGASEYSSNGFFDVHDAPPWDTWISFDGRRLVSWVPAVLIPLAQAGLDANAVDCIRWQAD